MATVKPCFLESNFSGNDCIALCCQMQPCFLDSCIALFCFLEKSFLPAFDSCILTSFDMSSLIKLVYFSRHEDQSVEYTRKKTVKERLGISNGNRRSYPVLGGWLHFVKFEISKLNECLDFISSKQLHCGRIDSHHWNSEAPANENAVIKATGGWAYKFAGLFKERLGVSIEKEDEMDCLVAGENFLLKVKSSS
ncbi:pantothenate kinase 2-like [Hibiscus syriacus]|uniref:pantothenate kinase 2-like n=1 Tax=Hibiscus syriacus TaxID=106335 RepID=UPI0019239BCB|nr:pantothenate kinase 2-like [Hibiscus syriacus]